MEIQNLERRNSEYALFELQRELGLTDYNYWEIFIGQIKFKCILSRWSWNYEYILSSKFEMKDHLHQESYARSCHEIEELKRRC